MKGTVIRCSDCCREFLFTDREKEFFQAKGWENPIRCPKCRAEKRLRRLERNYFVKLMEKREMRLYSKHGRGYFRRVGHY